MRWTYAARRMSLLRAVPASSPHDHKVFFVSILAIDGVQIGISLSHGGHQVAQKLSSTTLPRRSLRFMAVPAGDINLNSGASAASRGGVGLDCCAISCRSCCHFQKARPSVITLSPVQDP